MQTSPEISLTERLERATAARVALVDARHESAFRLFSGFYEGYPQLVVDVYGHTAVVHNYGNPPDTAAGAAREATAFLAERLPWIQAVVLKTRNAPDPERRHGRLLSGDAPDRRVRENGVWYAFEPMINRDASFYLDTRGLRGWAKETLGGKRVLNTFAYTGSLGVAARAGGAARVVHTDVSKEFLNVAKTSYTLNGFPIEKSDFLGGDFFAHMGRLKREGALFDCVFLDAPFLSVSDKGRIDLVAESHRLVNKVRPLVADGGVLVAINNALFLSGAEYVSILEGLCADGYMEIERFVEVPEDVTGYAATRESGPPVDPSPFNHSTKIALLRVRRKDARVLPQ